MEIFTDVIKYLNLLRFTDFIDIGIITIIIYYIIHLLRGTRAMQLIKGLVILVAVFVLSEVLHLNVLNYLLRGAISIGIVVVAVVFQPELRNMLERVGRLKLGSFIDLRTETDNDRMLKVIESVVKAACDMSLTRTGALIVLERETKLSDIIKTGTYIDAAVSSRLLENIFVPNTPLHDGAVVISGCRAMAASCLLPLTTNNNLSQDLGTRHRAAIGLSEFTDSVVVVVSEETGKISIALDGSLTRNLSSETLMNALRKTLMKENSREEKTVDKFKFWRSR